MLIFQLLSSSLGMLLLLWLASFVEPYEVVCEDPSNPATCYGTCKFVRKGKKGKKAEEQDCHCIREKKNKKCPKRPKLGYEPEIINALRSQEALNPYVLDCNPFLGPPCNDTRPPLPTVAADDPKIDGPVCGIKYVEEEDGNPPPGSLRSSTTSRDRSGRGRGHGHHSHDDDEVCPTEYTLHTYSTLQEASHDRAYVTHVGGCGVCSTTKDLAMYMENTISMEDVVINCVMQNYNITSGIPIHPDNITDMVGCMMALGSTSSCAQIWIYNGLDAFFTCGYLCVPLYLNDSDGQEQAPNDEDCKLNACLECDHVLSLPIFKKFAGRRRGLSGILSGTVRNCTEVASIEHFECSTKFNKNDYVGR
jgi:hypothetical protein